MSADNRGPLAGVVLALVGAVTGVVALRPRTIGVAFADGRDWTGWRPEHRAVLRSALVPLAATGDRWVEVPEALADVVVRTYDSGGRCEHAGQSSAVSTRESWSASITVRVPWQEGHCGCEAWARGLKSAGRIALSIATNRHPSTVSARRFDSTSSRTVE